MRRETAKLKLFPLGVVLFPGLPMPLHIFEDRYKQMVAECIEDDEPFGIVYLDETRMRKVGCTARIEDILKRYDDGKLDIVTRGERKFRILELDESHPYLMATVYYTSDEVLDEVSDEIPEAVSPTKSEGANSSLLDQSIAQLGRLAKITGSEIDLEALRAMDPERLSYLISGLDAFSAEEKQFFLELPTTGQRLLACVQSLANVVQTYDVSNEANELLPEGRLLHRFN